MSLYWGSTMTATNNDDQRRNLVKFVKPDLEFDDFLKVFFRVFIAVAVILYLVAVMICGSHGIGPLCQLITVKSDHSLKVNTNEM